MMNNLDRFSSPLETERVNPFQLQQALQEQNELNKVNLVDEYISNYWNNYGLVPNAELIQEHFYKIDLDQDMINNRISQF